MIENLENEQWLSIEGYEDYEVSNYGRVKSLERINNNNHLVKERILKRYINQYGYQQVTLYKDRKPKMFQVHRLVASAFIDNPNNYEQVNHKDECKTNNHVSNLEWCTAKFNSNYGTRNEKVSKALSGRFGKDCPNSKQVIQLNLNGEVIRNWDSMHDVERKLCYHNQNISACCSGKRKSAYGYKWVYA